MQFKQLFLLMMSGYFAGASLQVHAESRDLLAPKIVVASVYAGIGIVGFFGLNFLCKKEAQKFKSMVSVDQDTLSLKKYKETKETYSEESRLKKHFPFVEILKKEKKDVPSFELDKIKKNNEDASDFSIERFEGTFACKGKYHYSHGEFKRSVCSFTAAGERFASDDFQYGLQKLWLRSWVKAVGVYMHFQAWVFLLFVLKNKN